MRLPRRICSVVLAHRFTPVRGHSPFHIFGPPKSASRRRAVAALWRAAKAEGLAHSKTLSRNPQTISKRLLLDSESLRE